MPLRKRREYHCPSDPTDLLRKIEAARERPPEKPAVFFLSDLSIPPEGRMVTDLQDLLLEPLEVFKGLRLFSGIAQQGCRMIEGHHLNTAALKKLAVLLRDPEVLFYDLRGADPPEADDDFGTHQFDLPLQIAPAGIFLLPCWL